MVVKKRKYNFLYKTIFFCSEIDILYRQLHYYFLVFYLIGLTIQIFRINLNRISERKKRL